MKDSLRALLVQARHNPLDGLRLALEEQSVNIMLARTCAEAALVLALDSPPPLVFAEAQLVDGDWMDIMALAARALAPVSVVVVAPSADVGLYVDVIERGASDFIVTPVSDPELFYIVRNAADHALRRRKEFAANTRPSGISRTEKVTNAAAAKD
jgi:DNA-binding NtrC family response regulator